MKTIILVLAVCVQLSAQKHDLFGTEEYKLMGSDIYGFDQQIGVIKPNAFYEQNIYIYDPYGFEVLKAVTRRNNKGELEIWELDEYGFYHKVLTIKKEKNKWNSDR